jgi:hypothetical protein
MSCLQLLSVPTLSRSWVTTSLLLLLLLLLLQVVGLTWTMTSSCPPMLESGLSSR